MEAPKLQTQELPSSQPDPSVPDLLLPRHLVAAHPGAGGQLVRLRRGQRHHRVTLLHVGQLRVSLDWDHHQAWKSPCEG